MPRKDQTGRHATHYESLPHDNCLDPARCDCECPACLYTWNGWLQAVLHRVCDVSGAPATAERLKAQHPFVVPQITLPGYLWAALWEGAMILVKEVAAHDQTVTGKLRAAWLDLKDVQYVIAYWLADPDHRRSAGIPMPEKEQSDG